MPLGLEQADGGGLLALALIGELPRQIRVLALLFQQHARLLEFTLPPLALLGFFPGQARRLLRLARALFFLAQPPAIAVLDDGLGEHVVGQLEPAGRSRAFEPDKAPIDQRRRWPPT